MENIIINNIALFDPVTTSHIKKIMNKLAEISKNRRALRFPPHFTLRFSYEIPESSLDALVSEVNDEVQKLVFPIDFVADNISYTPWNAVYLDLKVTKELQVLHESIMEIGQKYRTPFISEELLKEQSFTDKQKQYINTYGYHQAFEFYSPHITLAGGKISPDKMDAVRNYKVDLPIKGKIEKIAFYKMGEGDNWGLSALAGKFKLRSGIDKVDIKQTLLKYN